MEVFPGDPLKTRCLLRTSLSGQGIAIRRRESCISETSGIALKQKKK